MKHMKIFVVWIVAVAALFLVAQGQAVAAPSLSAYLPLVVTPGDARPAIHSFTANPPAIQPGGTSTLTWNVTAATTLSISPDVGTVTGTQIEIKPTVTTEYTLTASNPSGTTTAKVTVTVTDGTPAPESGASWLPFDTNPDGTMLHTRGTNLAVDDHGGVHVAYAIRTGLDNGQRPAYYAFCATNCSTAEQWTRVDLVVEDWVMDVRIALDPAGHPRLMIFSAPVADSAINHYTYAACNSDCTAAASWTLTPLVTAELIDLSRWDYAFRYFALDPTGHPAFFYTDGSQGVNHNGTFYATCLKNPADLCSNAANWTEVKISPYLLDKPSLDFSPSGQPRAAFFFFDDTEEIIMRLLYLDCDADCLEPTNWEGIFMADMHGSARFSLRVDSQGRPRMIFYSGNYPDPAYQANRLYYLWCNTNCRYAGQNDWQVRDLELSKYHGQNADLVLDRLGRPRIAYDAFGGGLSLAWCDTGCESNAAVWQSRVLEKSAALEADYPVAPIRHCSISTWVSGQQPILALDQAGNLRIGYVAEHGYGGKDLDEPWKTCPTFADIILARYLEATQP
jgi:hypothetical protein